jgi:hypothetical protein
MRIMTRIALAAGLVFAVTSASAQLPDRGRESAARSDDATSFVARMMAFDKNNDGKLTRDEIADERLLRLFDRADANKDGVVTTKELVALFEREGRSAAGGPGGPGGRGPAGRGPGGPPRPGQVLPEGLRGQLDLTAEQQRQIADLQKDVDVRLEKILTVDQKAMLKAPGDRGRP